MKKYFLITLIIAFTAQINAQSNLVFNDVVTQFINGGETYTVPEGKVWKITGYNSQSSSLQINGEDPPIASGNTPIWLKAGQYINVTSPGARVIASIIEFNVVAVSSGSGTVNTAVDDFYTEGAGTSYGDDYTLGESVTDNDGNVYETVTIGPQTWTTSNLDVSTYRDGTPIPHITDYIEWATTPFGAYTYVLQDESGIYKKLYNLYAVIGKNDLDPNTPFKKLAPEGFHIPSIFEWQALIDFYGGSQSASSFLRSEIGWVNDLNGNNQSGLNILPGGYISNSSNPNANGFLGFSNILEVVVYGTSTTYSSQVNKSVSVTQSSVGIGNDFWVDNTAQSGVYIRLIKN